MSILIKGLAMPDCCWNCPCIDGEFGECNISGKMIRIADGRLTDCPLIELPDHGDLIDRDALPKYTGYALSANDVANAVINAKAVIPAERSDDDWEEPEINPCRGCDDYDGRGGCKSHGGCGAERSEG